MLIDRLGCRDMSAQDLLPHRPLSRRGAWWWQHNAKIGHMNQMLFRVTAAVIVIFLSLYAMSLFVPSLSHLQNNPIIWKMGLIVITLCALSRIGQYYINQLNAKDRTNTWLAEQVRAKNTPGNVDEAFRLLCVLNRNIKESALVDNSYDKQRLCNLCFEVATTYAHTGKFALALDLIPKERSRVERDNRKRQRVALLKIIQKECEWRFREADVREHLHEHLPKDILPSSLCDIVREYLISTHLPLREIQNAACALERRWPMALSYMRNATEDDPNYNRNDTGPIGRHICPKKESCVTLWVYKKCMQQGQMTSLTEHY